MTLRAVDRCDRCNAQALLLAMKGDDLDLLFCAFHANIHYDALVMGGWDLVDERPAVLRKAPVAT